LKLAISIDIGGTNTKIALVTSQGDIQTQQQLPTQSQREVSGYLQALFAVTEKLLGQVRRQDVAGIGIGAPGCNEREGTIEKTANLIIQEKLPIRRIFADRFKIPVQLVKDSNAAALGEHLFGGARGMSNFALLTLGTGLGCGLFINGRLVRGNSGLASELGHSFVSSLDRLCGCGRYGCLETYVSATGLRRTVFQLLAEELDDSELRRMSFAEMTAEHIFHAAGQGDRIALLAYDRTGEVLARRISDIAAMLELEAVFLSGGLAQSGELLLQPTRKYLEEHILYLMKDKIKVLPSNLGANDAALLGAASTVFDKQNQDIS
jgi:glucokinase